MGAERDVDTANLPLRELHILHFQLDRCIAVVFVQGWLEREVDGDADLEAVEEFAGAEGDGFHAGRALADEKLEMIAGLADAARWGGDLEAARDEERLAVAVTER